MNQPGMQCPTGRSFAPGARFATLLGWLLLAALPGSAFAASASNDNVDTNEDTPVLISPLANDTLMVFINSVVYDGPAEGSSFSLVGAPPTQIQFIPGPDFSGEVNLRYEACGVGIPPCDTANIDIDMLAVNDLPIAVDDAASLDEDSGFIDINVTANDTDVEDDPSDLDLLGGGAAIVSGPSNGTATRENDREIRYIPDPNFSGTDSFQYAIEDRDGGVATATVTVTVNPVDDPIFAGGNSASFAEDGSITLNVLFNDSSDDGGLVIIGTSPASNGTVTFTATTVTYTPTPDFFGTDSFTYTIDDAFGPDTATATVNITVNPVDDVPVALDDSVTGDEDTAIVVDVLANDSSADGGLFVASVGAAANGTVSFTATDVTYTPNANYFGPDSFTYTMNDALASVPATATVSVTVTNMDDAPDAVDDTASVVEDTPTLIDVLANDVDVDSAGLTILAASAGNGTVTILGGNQLEYTPNLDYIGADTIGYTIQDGLGGSVDSALVSVTVLEEDDPPVAVDDAVTTDEDIGLTGYDPLVNDSTTDSGTLFIVSATASEGTATVSGGGLTIDYAPVPGASGVVTIDYVLQDTVGASTDTATITVTLNSVNDLPIANDDTVVLDEDTPTFIDVGANDFLFDAPVTITAAGRTWTIEGIDYPSSSGSDPTTVVDPVSGDSVTRPNGTVEIQMDGTILYTPKANYNGSDFFEYTITDVDGETSSATVTITVNALNDAPTGPATQSFDMVENQSLTLVPNGILQPAFDADGDPITAVLQDLPANGVVTLESNGGFTYTPTLNFVGSDSFTFFLDDGTTTNGPTPLTVAINVAAAPPAPLPPPPGEVEFPFDLAQVPLELAVGVEPNVLIVMDDSGSMDWALLTSERNGSRMTIRGRNSTTTYSYPFEAGTNVDGIRNGNGRIVPSEEMLAADPADFGGNDYGVWRARNSAYNRIYYNPEFRYRPWRGLGDDNLEFPDADPTAALLDPWDFDGPTVDLTQPVRLRADNVPRFTRNGREDLDTNNGGVPDYYIPRYYRITDPAYTGGDPAHDTIHELVEIDDPTATYPGGADRIDCGLSDGDPLTCSYDEELQNFANWFTYYRLREYTVKASLGRVVAEQSELRIGYATFNNNNDREPIAPMNSTFRAGEKRELLDQIYRINSNGGTPLRQSLDRAGRHFACVAGDSFGSGGNSLPGSANCPIAADPAGACQANFALLFTDGEWNGGTPGGIDNNDGDDNTPFDGGLFGDGRQDTLADVAMRWYENDLHASLENLVPTTARDRLLAGPLAFGPDATTMHQHMTTFSVGFGVNGNLTDADIPADIGTVIDWGNPFTDGLAKTDDLRHAALNGRGGYLSAADPEDLEEQLQRAFDEFSSGEGAASAVAFNSQQLRQDTLVYRGFYNTRENTGDLIAQEIDLDTGNLLEPPVWSASGLLDLRSPNDRVIVTWDNDAAQGIPFRFGDLNAEQRAELDEDMVLYLRGARDNERPLGRQFRERPFDEALLGDIINSTPVYVGPPEGIRRDSLQYPVATSDLYSQFRLASTARRELVYVGANDGMLHAFDAANGQEVFAYVPDKIIADRPYANPLFQLTSPAYGHKYFVDGTPALNDIFMDPDGGTDRSWRTVLIGSLRAGGKGYFALDVTDPSAFDTESNAAAQVLWEFDDGDDTYPVDALGDPVGGAVGALVDLQGLPVKDLGYTFSVPSIVMTNIDAAGSGSETGAGGIASPEKKWAAIFGNGYNSTYGVAKLFVNFIEDAADGTWDAGDFEKLDTGFGVPAPGEQNEGLPNGLGTPRVIDLNGDGTADYAYAGDLLGNLFRFDMTSDDPDNWTVTRIFKATYTDGTEQPITTQPIVTRNPQAQGVIVIFATGSFITEPDGVSDDIQSLYGIWDRVQASPFSAEASPPTATGDRSLLVEQNIINLQDPSFGALRTFTANDVVYDAATVRGWVLDFDAPRAGFQTDGSANPDSSGNDPGAGGTNAQFPGERAVRNLQLRGGFLFVNTVIPRDDSSCERSPGGFALALNPITGGIGGQNEEIAFDLNNDGLFDSDDLVGGSIVGGLRFDDAVPTDSSFIGTRRFTQLSDRSVDIRNTNTGTSARSGRLSWREME